MASTKPKMKEIPIEEYERLIKDLDKLKKDTTGFNKLKSQLLQVSKKETEEYANNIAEYSSVFDSMKAEIEQLQDAIQEYQRKEQAQTKQLRTATQTVKSTRSQCQQKEERIQKIRQQNMSLQNEKEMLKQQICSLRENFYNDEQLVSSLCAKLKIECAHNFDELVNFVCCAKRINEQYEQLKQEMTEKREQYKIELASFRKQLEEKKNMEKGTLIQIESLCAENANLKRRIADLERNNDALHEQLQSTRHEINELNLSKQNLNEKCVQFGKEVASLKQELNAKHIELEAIYKHQQSTQHEKGSKLANFNKLTEDYKIICNKYEILKKHCDGLNKDRSVAIEKLKCESQESERKLSKLQNAIAELNEQRVQLESELKQKQIELANADEERLKWKAKTNRLKEETTKVSKRVLLNEVKVQEEFQSLQSENNNLKQEVEKKIYEIDELNSKNKQIEQQLDEWKMKYDEINEKYEFESGQHDNTLKKLNDIRSIWDGRTDSKQLLQTIHELQSKLNQSQKDKATLKTENNALHAEMQQLKESKKNLHNALTENQRKLKEAEQHVIASESKISHIEAQKDSLSKKLRTLSASNTKLRLELSSSSSAADLVQEQLKTSAVATTHKEQKLEKAEEQFTDLRSENYQLQHIIDKLLNQMKVRHQHEKIQNESLELKRTIKELENVKCSMMKKQEMNTKLRDKYCQPSNPIQSKKGDILDSTVEQFQSDKTNIHEELKSLRTSYFEQVTKFKNEHKELYNKYKQISTEKEKYKKQTEQLLTEKQVLEDVELVQIQQKYDELLGKNAELISKLTAVNTENKKLKLNYQRIAEKRSKSHKKIIAAESKDNDENTKAIILVFFVFMLVILCCFWGVGLI